MNDAVLAWSGVFGAMLCFGTFAVPMKAGAKTSLSLHPIVFQTYVSFGVLLTSLPVMLLPSWEFSHFTMLGLCSAFIWTLANMLCAMVVELLGVSVGQSLWSGMVALVSFLEGLAFGETLENPVCAVIGIILLVGGIIGLAWMGSGTTAEPSSLARESESSCSSTLAEAAIGATSVERPPSTASTRRPLARGLVFVVWIGLLAGSLFVPLRYTGLEGGEQILFSVSFGVGAVCGSLFLLLAHTLARHCSRGRMQPLGSWAPGEGLLRGMLCGMLWNGGNICSILALLPPLGMGVGYPLTQTCILVGGLWGILVFKEITGCWKILYFFTCAAVVLTGATLLGVFR